MNKENEMFRFNDPRDIRLGKARIIWGTETTTSTGETLESGWVMPGGARTNNAAIAFGAGGVINSISRRSGVYRASLTKV